MNTNFVIPGFVDSVKLSIPSSSSVTCFDILSFLAFNWLVR